MVGNVDVILCHCCRADAIMECVLKRPCCRHDLEDVPESRSLGLRRERGDEACIHDAGFPRLWRSPYHIPSSYPCCHLLSLQLRTSRSLLCILSLSLFFTILRSATSANLYTMARRGPDGLNFIAWTVLKMRFQNLLCLKRFAWLPHIRLWHWKQFVAVTAVAIELPTHGGNWL